MQKLSDEKIKIIPGSGQNVSGPLDPKRGFLFGFFTSPRAETRWKNNATALKEPALKSPRLNVPRVDLTAVRNWVALEERIVHDYKEQKTAQFRSAIPLSKTFAQQLLPGPSNLNNQEKKMSSTLATKKEFTLFGLFISPRAEIRGKNTSTALNKPVLKSPRLNVPRANLTAVRNWVALEEKIVHDYKEQKTAQFKRAVPLPQTLAKQPLPAFETFTTQTAVSLPPSIPKLKDPLRGSKKAFSGIAGFLLVCGWLALGTFIFLHVQETFSSRKISQKLTQLQNEKKQLEKSYAALENVSEDQGVEMEWLNGQLRNVALELKTAKADKVVYEQGLEKKYREELTRITVRYESELAALRGTVQTQNAIVNALRAQSQVFGKIVDQVGMSALSGAAARLSQGPFLTGGTSMLQGKVASVNGRQGFVVINLGSEQGVRYGRLIIVSRDGTELTIGRIDRVYPTMSVAIVRDAGMLQVIREGDSVSFS